MNGLLFPVAAFRLPALPGDPTGVTPLNPVDNDAELSWQGTTLKQLLSDPRFLVVPETMVDGLIVIDTQGIIHYVNPACVTLFGHAKEDMIGRNVSILMPSPFREQHDAYLAHHRDTGVKRIIGIGRQLQGMRADGTVFPMYLSVGETKTADTDLFVGIIYDLTEKKRAEETILHHQKLDAIGQLSGGIAHDFNNILSVIGGNLEMIGDVDLPPAARRALLRAQDAATRAARITHRLLAFARKQPLTKKATDLTLALRDMSEILQRAIGEHIQVRMDLPKTSTIVETDIDQFETAILNLVVNARDAMPNGGIVAIEAERVTYHDDPRTTAEVPAGDYVRVSVSDTGSGMSPEVCARAIEPFFTTKEVGSGTGLGLSMVHGFMKQIGGHARIYSELGKGTRVSLFFPIAESIAEKPAAPAEETAPLGHGEYILVVEDDPDVRLVTVSRLEALGYNVRVATEGASALEIVRSGVDIDLALIDVVMPGQMDGHMVTHAIKQTAPHIKTILTSGYSPHMATAGVAADQPFLQKPASRLQLAKLVNRVLASKNGAAN